MDSRDRDHHQVAAQVGVLGTLAGCTPTQLRSLRDVLFEMVVDDAWEIHIADATGVASEAHQLWRALRQRVVIHPSRGDGERPRLDHEETRPVLSVRERDIAICHECQALVLVPAEGETWEAWPSYMGARRRCLALFIVLPSGHVRQWTHGMAPLMPELEETTP